MCTDLFNSKIIIIQIALLRPSKTSETPMVSKTSKIMPAKIASRIIIAQTKLWNEAMEH